MQAHVSDNDETDEPMPSAAKRAARRRRQDGEERKEEHARHQKVPSGQTQRRRDEEEAAIPGPPPRRVDEPPSLEKRQGGRYRGRPATKFAREELDPRRTAAAHAAAAGPSPESCPRSSASSGRGSLSSGHTKTSSAAKKKKDQQKTDHSRSRPPRVDEQQEPGCRRENKRDPFENFPPHIRPQFNKRYE